MTPLEFVYEGTLGGPGLDGYAYQAEVFCPDCGEAIYRKIAGEIAPTIEGTDDPLFLDSETCPQPIFSGEADGGEWRCAECGTYLCGEGDWNGEGD